tara:strand:- start:1285 stop:1659 length:375 start_codon:yes stop_codon:yes gene_type:complete
MKKPTQLVDSAISLLVNTTAKEHMISASPDNPELGLKVWVRELSFMQMQNAIKTFLNITAQGGVDIDLASYWKHMFAECIEKTEPRLTPAQMMQLQPFVAKQITALLPQPQDLISTPLSDGENE